MKRILVLIPAAALLTYCSSSKSTQTASGGSGTAAKRWNMSTGDSSDPNVSDTVVVTGTEFIPVLGKSETGMRPDLEGTWVLSSMNAAAADLKNPNNIIAEKASEPAGAANRRDTVTTRTSNGTSTTVYMSNRDTTKKITPPQGSNMHEAEKPSLSFFGSNETFSGFTGCNKIAGRYQINGTNISFQHSAPSTRMVCIGEYDETAFLNTLKRVNIFKSGNGKLQLLEGNTVLFVFTKK